LSRDIKREREKRDKNKQGKCYLYREVPSPKKKGGKDHAMTQKR